MIFVAQDILYVLLNETFHHLLFPKKYTFELWFLSCHYNFRILRFDLSVMICYSTILSNSSGLYFNVTSLFLFFYLFFLENN